MELGAPVTRGWFFNLEDAPWHEQPHGVEGWWSRAARSTWSPARRGSSWRCWGSEPGANRCLDLLLLTNDLEDTFKTGERAYPILDEIGVAAAGRVFMRITNPADSGESFHVEGKYTVNRVPWTFPGRDRQSGAGAGDTQPPAEPRALAVGGRLVSTRPTPGTWRSTRSTTARIDG